MRDLIIIRGYPIQVFGHRRALITKHSIALEGQDWSYCEINFGISNKDIPDGALEKINNMYMNFFFEELKFYDARLCTKEEYLTSCDETKYDCQHWEVK